MTLQLFCAENRVNDWLCACVFQEILAHCDCVYFFALYHVP